MKQKKYIAPQVETLEVSVEEGFAYTKQEGSTCGDSGSGQQTVGQFSNGLDWSNETWSEQQTN